MAVYKDFGQARVGLKVLFGFQLEGLFYFLIYRITECLDGTKQMVVYQNFEIPPTFQTEILEIFRDV